MVRNANKQAILGLGAVALRDRLASGEITAVQLVEACLDRIGEHEPQVGAWAWLDGDHAIQQAQRLDQWRQMGRPLGPLHGLPVGLKDIIDTKGIPTENGTPIDAGRVPNEDAWIVARLRAAGAIILGKTVTTEAAFMHAGKTRNPHNPDHTPGGSSSGSAAAVAAGMVPFAIGTQTGGSVIRPASFCGVVGFKPSFGLIPRTGILSQSPHLDTVGVFARTVEDCALLAEVIAGYDPQDRATAPVPMPRMLDVAASKPPVQPDFALARIPGWDQADPQMTAAIEELVDLLGDKCIEAPLPELSQAAKTRELINFAEMAKCYYHFEARGRDQLSDKLRTAIDTGKDVMARDYISALDWREVLNAGFDAIFNRADAIICPAALGPAPHGLEDTGNPIFNGLWTLAGMPSVTIPLFVAENGMPMGVQLVGRRNDDARLLRTANWLNSHIETLETGN